MTRISRGERGRGVVRLVCSRSGVMGTHKAGSVSVPLPAVELALKQLRVGPPPSSTVGLDEAIMDVRIRSQELERTVGTLIDQIEHSASPALPKRLAEREAEQREVAIRLAELEAKRAHPISGQLPGTMPGWPRL
jgi:hypothetical protein